VTDGIRRGSVSQDEFRIEHAEDAFSSAPGRFRGRLNSGQDQKAIDRV
jgi:hypothetical protein